MRIELRDICKQFGEIVANDSISIGFCAGTIHGLLGENGAGKSTLMKILAGYCAKDSGTVLIDGIPREYGNPATALKLGIGMLYQEPHDFPRLSVLDNFRLGQVPGISAGQQEVQKRFDETAGNLGFSLPLFDPVESLSFGERQQLELMRLIDRNISVLILDEPTTGITDRQKCILFFALKKLAAAGKTIILLSHKMEDVTALCDTVTVLRDGRVKGDIQQPFHTKTLLNMMFDDRPSQPKCQPRAVGRNLLDFRNVSFFGGRSNLTNCNVAIQQGEVIGLAGIEGSGQDHFLRLACGLIHPSQGKILFNRMDMTGKHYGVFKSQGVAFIPTSRLEEGLVPQFTIADHFTLNYLKRDFFLSYKRIRQAVWKHIERFRIKGKPETMAANLSGGNQQRLLLSFLPPSSRLILIENPTRGLDVASARWIWNDLNMFCNDQTAIVFSSPEIDELINFASRILVFFNGEIIKDVKTEETHMDDLTSAIAGLVEGRQC